MNQEDQPNRLPALPPRLDSPHPAETPPGQYPRSAMAEAEPALTLLEVLLRHKARLIACVAVALCLGVLYQLKAPRQYQSTAEVFIEQSRDNRPGSPLRPSGVSAGQPSTHASLLRSTAVLKAALTNPQVADAAFFEGRSDPVGHLRKKLDIDFSKERETLKVSLRTGVPEESAAIVNAVIDAYLRTQESQVRVLDGADLTAEATRPGGVMSDELIAARLRTLSEELTQAQVALHAAESRYQDAAAASADVIQLASMLDAAGLDSRAYGMTELAYLKAELARLDQQLEGMPPSWGPEHQLRGPVQRQADALRYEIERLRRSAAQAMLGLLETNRQQARQRFDELATQVRQEEVNATRSAQLPVIVIERGEVPLKKVSPKGVKSLGVALFLGLAVGVMWVLYIELNQATPSPLGRTRPTQPRPESEPAVLRVTSEVMPTLAPPTAAASPLLLHSDAVSDELAAAHVPMLGLIPQVAAARSLTSPDIDDTASSIHQVRAVLQVQANSKGTRAYAFTSPRRGAGKTSVTIGVATSLAMSGTRTLVVDCDLAGRIARHQTGTPAPAPGSNPASNGTRRSHADAEAGPRARASGVTAFGPIDAEGSSPDNASLDNIALEQGYLGEHETRALASADLGQRLGVPGMLDGASLADCLVHATVENLCLLPAIGATTRHIGKMSDAFIRRLIEEARGSFDLILFDTGPIPGSVEALLVTSQADGVIVVVPQGESRANLNRTMSYLKVVDAHVTGTVFNKSAGARPPAAPAPTPRAAAADPTPPAADAADRRTKGEPASAVDALEAMQRQDEDDAEFVAMDAHLGSGILAAAVFSDADSGFANKNWQLAETSEFAGTVDALFGPMEDAEDEDADAALSHRREA